MGTYNKGILGPFSGKIGTVVGSSWRGKDYMRSLPKKGNRTPTQQQSRQRLRFATVQQFLVPLQPVLRKCYGLYAGEFTRTNRAMSYHMTEAVVFNDPGYDILYPKVQISKGDLQGLTGETFAPTPVGDPLQGVALSWSDNSGEGEALATDQLVVALYEPTTKTTRYQLNAAQRNAVSAVIALPANLSGLTVHAWAAFAAADGSRQSASTYLGSVLLP